MEKHSKLEPNLQKEALQKEAEEVMSQQRQLEAKRQLLMQELAAAELEIQTQQKELHEEAAPAFGMSATVPEETHSQNNNNLGKILGDLLPAPLRQIIALSGIAAIVTMGERMKRVFAALFNIGSNT